MLFVLTFEQRIFSFLATFMTRKMRWMGSTEGGGDRPRVKSHSSLRLSVAMVPLTIFPTLQARLQPSLSPQRPWKYVNLCVVFVSPPLLWCSLF